MSDTNISKMVSGVILNIKYKDVDNDIDAWFKCFVTKVNGYGNNDAGTYVDVNIIFEDGEEVINECIYEHLYDSDKTNGWHILNNEYDPTHEPGDNVVKTYNNFEMSISDNESITTDEAIMRPSIGAFERGFDKDDEISYGIKTIFAICTGVFFGLVSLSVYSMYKQYISSQA